MIKNFDYNRYTDKDLKVYNKVSLFEALQQASRVETSFGDSDKKGQQGGGNERSNISVKGKMEIGTYIPNKGKFNVQAALEWARNNCCTKSQGKCAKYVRQMIEAGGLSTAGRPVSAYQYASFLPKIGFMHIISLTGKSSQMQWSNTEAQPGDISVMAHGQHGHICMWTGKQWVSDFVQNNMWPYKGDGLCEIFRYGG